MKLLSYNTGGGRPMKLTADTDELSRLLTSVDPDVAVLQEVHLAPGSTEQFRDAMKTIGYKHIVFGMTIRDRTREYGNVVISRITLEQVEYIDLTVEDREPRWAILVSFFHEGIKWEVATTHLGLLGNERCSQIRRIHQRIESEEFNDSPEPDISVSVLAGDLNVWNRFSKQEKLLRQCFGKAPRKGTFPAWLPFLALDRIFRRIDSPSEIGIDEKWSVIRGRHLALASDHAPILYQAKLRII